MYFTIDFSISFHLSQLKIKKKCSVIKTAIFLNSTTSRQEVWERKMKIKIIQNSLSVSITWLCFSTTACISNYHKWHRAPLVYVVRITIQFFPVCCSVYLSEFFSVINIDFLVHVCLRAEKEEIFVNFG